MFNFCLFRRKIFVLASILLLCLCYCSKNKNSSYYAITPPSWINYADNKTKDNIFLVVSKTNKNGDLKRVINVAQKEAVGKLSIKLKNKLNDFFLRELFLLKANKRKVIYNKISFSSEFTNDFVKNNSKIESVWFDENSNITYVLVEVSKDDIGRVINDNCQKVLKLYQDDKQVNEAILSIISDFEKEKYDISLEEIMKKDEDKNVEIDKIASKIDELNSDDTQIKNVILIGKRLNPNK